MGIASVKPDSPMTSIHVRRILGAIALGILGITACSSGGDSAARTIDGSASLAGGAAGAGGSDSASSGGRGGASASGGRAVGGAGGSAVNTGGSPSSGGATGTGGHEVCLICSGGN